MRWQAAVKAIYEIASLFLQILTHQHVKCNTEDQQHKEEQYREYQRQFVCEGEAKWHTQIPKADIHKVR